MTQPYVDKLSNLVQEANVAELVSLPLAVKHFFNGAALYADGAMCASWSPAGLAFKLPQVEVTQLINSGKAKPLRYFPKGHFKKGYALFEVPDYIHLNEWLPYLLTAIEHGSAEG